MTPAGVTAAATRAISNGQLVPSPFLGSRALFLTLLRCGCQYYGIRTRVANSLSAAAGK